MINRTALLEDLKRLVTRVEADLLARSEAPEVPEIAATLRGEYDRARAAKRTAATYSEWRDDRITQAAVAWVLSCVFVRFLEDNDLIAPPRLSGPGERLRDARNAHQHFFMSHPRDTDREYLLSIFDELAALPGTADIFGAHNALREIPTWLSGDAARDLLRSFQQIDNASGALVHDFTDPAWDSRFLGDLYQDLSAFARERYALLQTPHFVEQFLLDRTLEPALDEFGLTEAFKMIDPACGSGHLVLGSFARILDRWQRAEPATPVRELVRRTLGSVHGVDINPFAVAIARFRLLLVAMRACGVSKLSDAPAFHLNIECGDSLLHTPLIGGVVELFDKHEKGPKDEECDHAYASEDLAAVKRILQHSQYRAVMANPPYITPKDPGLRDRYRDRFATCHMKYSLAVPFMEHIFKLCAPGGFTGQITANSFMKREFGKKLIEKFFPVTDLTHVIDTSGAYIPGHGTPTVILFGRQRRPVADTVRAVMGIRGEPSTPADPARGLVWTAITTQVDQPGSQSEFVSVADTPRATFGVHPWSLGGGGAAELKALLDQIDGVTLDETADSIGIVCFTLEDDIFLLPREVARRKSLPRNYVRTFVSGDSIRDWTTVGADCVVFAYDSDYRPAHLRSSEPTLKYLWQARTTLSNNKMFGGKTKVESGLKWYELGRLTTSKLTTPLSVLFPSVSSHNHYVMDSSDSLFNCSTLVIKFPKESSALAHLQTLGFLNSSVHCFWMKQVFYAKERATGDISTEKCRPETNRYAISSTGVGHFVLPQSSDPELLADLTKELHETSAKKVACMPDSVLADWTSDATESLRQRLRLAEETWTTLHRRTIALQEESDWEVYRLFGLSPHGASPSIFNDKALGCDASDRPFMWRGASAPPTTPTELRAEYERRRHALTTSPTLSLIESLVFKRPWWGRQGVYGRLARDYAGWQAEALQAFLLDRLERLFDFDGRMNDSGTPTATLPLALVSLGEVATAARRDPLFMEAAEVFTGDVAFDPLTLITSLVDAESVPLLPVLRYKPTGLRKHAEWQGVWELQRKEDAIDVRTSLPADNPQHLTADDAKSLKDALKIPVPPKYTSADFLKPSYWRLRGKLDVPKERFVSFPGIVGQDGTGMIAWAGLNHLQLAKAIGDFYGLVQTEIGGSDDPRLVPLLAAIHELIPWIRQWHPGNDPAYGSEPAEFFENFVQTDAAALGMTVADVTAWQPPARTRAKRAAKKAAKKASKRSTKKTPAEPDA
jgi:hypothetical protein